MLGRISKDLTLPTITCSKLTLETLEQGVKYVQTIKTPERRQCRRSGAFTVNLERIPDLNLLFLLLTLNM